jgi:hypothetical protein
LQVDQVLDSDGLGLQALVAEAARRVVKRGRLLEEVVLLQ